MNRFNSQLIATALTTSLAAAPALAAEPDPTPQHLGAGAGALAGAVVGGPVGAILGTAFGALVGRQQVQQHSLEAQQQEQAELSQRLRASYAELAALEQRLQQRQTELAATQQQVQRLDQQHSALKAMVGGLQLPLYFAHNSSALDPRYDTLLRSLSDGAAKVEGLSIDLAGHANRAGAPDYNLDLSLRRGEQVSAALTQHGLAPLRIVTHGEGDAAASANPYAAQDRRVELRFRFADEPKDQLFSVR